MDKYERLAEANQVFTPGFPVQQKDLFAGRTTQLQRTIETLTSPGRHPVIFGQRGVGKTSLANILGDAFKNIVSVKVSCDGTDTFATIWNRILYNASITFKQQAFGFDQSEATRTISLADALGHDPNTTKAAEIADLLKRLTGYSVVILDEFDKVTDTRTKAIFADLIKILSDNAPRVTLILVGVAENIHELIGEHPSIERNLVHVELPLMSADEIKSIVNSGFSKTKIKADNSIVDQIPLLASGYPHYAHLLGQCSVKVCADNNTYDLTSELFNVACNIAVEDAIEKYREAFAKATATTQSSRYPLILSACGYATTDARGIFRATDVVEAVKEVFNESVTVQAVVPALGEFLSRERTSVLKAFKIGGKQCYRFSDPMMRPYCRLKARDLLQLKQIQQ